MMNKTKFNTLYEQVMSELNSIRKGLQKIDQMNTKDFLAFLREILPLFKENKLDLNEVTITEKSDGTALRLIIIDNELYFESSHSGIVTWDKMPFPNQTKWIYDNLKTKLLNIGKTIGFDYKIICELIWSYDMIDDGKITPVGTSYLASHFGTYGGLIIIDLKQINNNQLNSLDLETFNKLTQLLKKCSNNEFIIYSKQDDLQFDKTITLSYNINELIELLKLPEYNKYKYSSKTDQEIIDKVNQIKSDFLVELETIVNNTKGHFSDETDLIEGLVLTVLNTGNEYGIFSNGYKDMKSKYWKYSTYIEDLQKQFLFKLCGLKQLAAIRNKWNILKPQIDIKIFNQLWSEYKQLFKINLDNFLNDTTIPTATKTQQLYIINKIYNNILNINSFKEWENYYIYKEKLD